MAHDQLVRVRGALLLAALCSCSGTARLGHVATPAETRVITGTIRDSITGLPLEADVDLAEAPVRASSDASGHFQIRGAPAGAVTLYLHYMGCPPSALQLPADSDTVALWIVVCGRRPRAPPPKGPYPRLAISEMRVIWAELLRGLHSEAASEFGHIRQLGRPVAGSGQADPMGSPSIVLSLDNAPPELREPNWLGELLRARLLVGACHSPGMACPDSGFHLYVAPGYPERFAEDSVTVPLNFTAIDPTLCRQGRGAGDEGHESKLLAKSGDTWRYVGADRLAERLIGGLACNAPQSRPR